MKQQDILDIIYKDIEEMDRINKSSDPVTQSVINYAFDLVDRIKGKTK